MITPSDDWTDPSCPVARALDLVGDRWSLLIVRDAMDGAHSFSDFQARTGIARNILSERLRRLGDRGVIARRLPDQGRRPVYELTESGRDLFTTIVALRQWGERHAFAEDEPRSILVDELGQPVTTLTPATSSGAVAGTSNTSVRRPAPRGSSRAPTGER